LLIFIANALVLRRMIQTSCFLSRYFYVNLFCKTTMLLMINILFCSQLIFFQGNHAPPKPVPNGNYVDYVYPEGTRGMSIPGKRKMYDFGRHMAKRYYPYVGMYFMPPKWFEAARIPLSSHITW